jgi:hypothetical protein
LRVSASTFKVLGAARRELSVGGLVDRRNARAFADALQRAIDGGHGDGEVDLGALAAVVNFVRDGPFAIL